MSANSVIRVSDINFDAIKNSLKAYLQSRGEFRDYDFESSTLSILLDTLAYNTYLNAMYTNFIGNEMFLDSALLRNSVVSRAKMLNYVPRSNRGATATLQITITPNDSPTQITVAKNTRFTTSIDGQTYTFVTPQAYNIANNGGVFSANVDIREGLPVTHRWTVSSTSSQRYIIPNENVDTRSIAVNIITSSSNNTSTAYTQASDLSAVSANSKVYFLQENEDQQYELIFGDGVFGKALSDGNIVSVNYQISNGSKTNGANTFTASGTIGGYSDFTLSLSARASGGANIESIDSIKYNAPRAFEAQNRLVTAEDYKNAILSDNGDIQSIAVWGGEENSPPNFGKVYISVKPTDSTIISNQRKSTIVSNLKTRNVLSIEPVLVDATFLYIVPTIQVKYNPSLTNLTAAEVMAKVQTAIINFERSKLGVFGNTFYHSAFIRALVDSDPSVVSALADIEIQKRFVPVTSARTQYNLSFNNAIFNPYTGYRYAVSKTTSFTESSRSGKYFDDDGAGNLRVYYLSAGSRVYTNRTAGTVSYGSGLVTIDNLQITDYVGTEVKVNVVPDSEDISSVRNQLLLITDVSAELTDISTGNRVASLNNISTQGQSAELLQSQISNVIF